MCTFRSLNAGYFLFQENSDLKEIKEELSPQEEQRLSSKNNFKLLRNDKITNSYVLLLYKQLYISLFQLSGLELM